MISVPIWLFVIMCICSAIVLLLITLTIVANVVETKREKEEIERYFEKKE